MVGVIELLRSAIGALVETAFGSVESSEVSSLVREIEETAKQKAALTAMQSRPELQKFLLNGLQKKTFFQDIKAYCAIELGIEMLESFYECHQKLEIQPSVFFKSYEEAFIHYNQTDQERESVEVIRNEMPAVEHIIQSFHQKCKEPTTVLKLSDMQKTVFYEFYQAKMNEPWTDVERTAAKNYWENSANNNRYVLTSLKQLDIKILRQFLESNPESLKAKIFVAVCEKNLESYVKQQALFKAMKLSPSVLEEFVIRYRSELNTGEINVNQRFREFEKWELVPEVSDNSNTALTWLVKWGPKNNNVFQQTLEILLREGADINAIDNTCAQWTPLHAAVQLSYGSWQVIPLLMQKEGVDHTLKDYKGRTPLSILVDEIEKKFDNSHYMHSEIYVDSKTHQEKLIFLSAIYVILEALISPDTVNIKDSSPQSQDFFKQKEIPLQDATPLFKFLFYSFKLFNIELEDHKRSVDATADSVSADQAAGAPPSVEEFIQLFIEAGADINAKDINGDTILHQLARLEQSYNRSILEKDTMQWAVFLCQKFGASPSEKNNNNQKAENIAEAQDRPVLARTFREIEYRNNQCYGL